MRKTFPLQIEGRHPDRVLDAIRHDIRKALKRDRRHPLPEGAHHWEFDCRFGPNAEEAQAVNLASLNALIDEAARTGQPQIYVEFTARPAARRAAPAAEDDGGAEEEI
ncbi:MAG TPA: DUF6172 family protein [Burkholderiaceae bacterium]|nr:DUF6172 family protein [Burkholderiaceae bacterium]